MKLEEIEKEFERDVEIASEYFYRLLAVAKAAKETTEPGDFFKGLQGLELDVAENIAYCSNQKMKILIRTLKELEKE